MRNTSPQNEENEETQTLEMENNKVSLNEPKITTKKETTKQDLGDRNINKSNSIAAATSKETSEEGKKQKQSSLRTDQLTAVPSQIERESENKELYPNKEKEVTAVDALVNPKWKELIPLLDSTGIPINKTLISLLKLYPSEKVENAIALYRNRKREKYIENPSGYFTKILEGDWASKSLANADDGDSQIDLQAVFGHWYDLARQLGYCSGREMREGEQWVCLSGAWEKWSDAVARGYDLSYLKKVVQRNQGR